MENISPSYVVSYLTQFFTMFWWNDELKFLTVWGANAYTSQSPLVPIDGTLNNDHYISVVLRSVAQSLIRNAIFLLNNARPHVVSIVWTFVDAEIDWMLSCPNRSQCYESNVSKRLLLYSLFDPFETLRYSRIMLDRTLRRLFGPSFM